MHTTTAWADARSQCEALELREPTHAAKQVAQV